MLVGESSNDARWPSNTDFVFKFLCVFKNPMLKRQYEDGYLRWFSVTLASHFQCNATFSNTINEKVVCHWLIHVALKCQ